jgi:plasmid replication initiation protein
MAYPFFSLAKTKRVTPIDYRLGEVTVRVEGTHQHGIATIWDADVLIWAISLLVQARDEGRETSRRIATTPHTILKFIRRGCSVRDYTRLRAALDRLQSTTVATSLRQPTQRRMHRFSWLNEWRECADRYGRPIGIELILPDWLYTAITDPSRVLTIDPAYFRITGGVERWVYRLARKHAGTQVRGWRFDFTHLHRKSGSLARFSDFTLDLRRIARRQALPGYQLLVLSAASEEWLCFKPVPSAAPAQHGLHQ